MLHKGRNLKFQAGMQPAIFLGYVFQPGGKWFGEYQWAFLDDLADKPFNARASYRDCHVAVHSGREMQGPEEGHVSFPCREMYVRDNTTLDGISRCQAEEAANTEADGGSGSDPETESGDDHVDEDEVGPPDDDDVPEDMKYEREPFAQRVADELKELKDKDEHNTGMLEFIRTRRDKTTNKWLDQFGHVIQKGSPRPPYVWPDLWRDMGDAKKERDEGEVPESSRRNVGHTGAN